MMSPLDWQYAARSITVTSALPFTTIIFKCLSMVQHRISFRFRAIAAATIAGMITLTAQLALTVETKATEAAWVRVSNGGYSILLAHAPTMGRGQPAGFELGDCSTQNTLSDRGRTMARRWGTRFAARAVTLATIYTSQWCSAGETANLAFGSYSIEEAPAFNLLGSMEADEDAQYEEMLDMIGSFRGPGNQLFITHPENITALTGTRPRDGEAVVVELREEGEDPNVVGRILLN